MKFKHLFILMIVSVLLLGSLNPALAAKDDKVLHINVLLNTEITDEILAELGQFGKVQGKIDTINVLSMKIKTSDLQALKSLPFIEGANPDRERKIPPMNPVPVPDFLEIGYSTWNLDSINVTANPGPYTRSVSEDGSGVYIAVLDTGLLKNWRYYLPEERISTEYAKSFSGGGSESANISEQPIKWEHDTHSHGTHVSSTILGFDLSPSAGFYPITGVAPKATVIPVKVLNQNGSGSSFVVAQGIKYIGDLKAGPLAAHPVVINMSLGGPELDVAEKAAIDYAIAQGVIIVASAGNEGEAGMGYPGAYAPVISVAASGWVGEWKGQRTNPLLSTYYRYWWYLHDVSEPTDPNLFYIAKFSSRQSAGQDLDITAPGSWVVGPYEMQHGQPSYYFVGGTSMASPHVAGIVALMAQKDTTLTALEAETILETSAIGLAPGCRFVGTPYGTVEEICWGADATGAGLVDAAAALFITP